jgi:glutathione S-transferase
MAVKLHRCSTMWVKINGHPCWKVQKALDEQGVEYEVVKGPLRRGKRDDLERLSGQRQYPVIEFEDGSVYRAESKEMAERIREGKLLEGKAPTAEAATPTEAARPPAPPEPGGVPAPPEPREPPSA